MPQDVSFDEEDYDIDDEDEVDYTRMHREPSWIADTEMNSSGKFKRVGADGNLVLSDTATTLQAMQQSAGLTVTAAKAQIVRMLSSRLGLFLIEFLFPFAITGLLADLLPSGATP